MGCPLSATMQTGQVQQAMVFMHHQNGSRIPIEVWGAPLTDESGKIIGAVEVFSDKREANSIVWELGKLQKEVLADPLTALGNRRYLELVAEAAFRTLERDCTSFFLYLIDIDKFKVVNDTHGHLTGDKIIKMIAETLKASIRPNDAVARWGGDEFMILCSGISLENAHIIAERMRMLVENSWFDVSGENPIRVTISIGVAQSRKGEKLEQLTKRADEQLYKAKQEGKDRYAICS